MEPLAPIAGEDPAFLDVLEHLGRMAAVERPCLIVGERGTGKELFATRLHYLSPRWERTVLKVNCAALTETLLESELFGHEAGAFTGASRRHLGCFERADGGTLVLDEIASASSAVQEKLLRVIEYGELQRVGGSETLQVDVRVVGAANVDLPSLAARGAFRADLLDRLSFDVVTLPPLRARPADILPLAEGFALEMTRALERDLFAGFTEDARALLRAYAWPGNVRELKNVVERAVYQSAPDAGAVDVIVIDPFDSPWRPGGPSGPGVAGVSTGADPAAAAPGPASGGFPPTPPSSGRTETKTRAEPAAQSSPAVPFRDAVARFERARLEDALASTGNNQRAAAKLLGLGYHQLRRLLAKHGLGAGRKARAG